MASQKLNAIIMAGTSSDRKKLIDEHDGRGSKNKTLVTINKYPVIKNIVQALQDSDYINHDKITIIGPNQEVEEAVKDKSIHYLSEKKSFIENCVTSYDYISPNGEKTFIVMGDVPFIASDTMNNFIEQASNYDVRFCFSVINVKNIPKDMEPFKKTKKFHLRGRGYYRTANMGLFKDSKTGNRKSIENHIRAAFEARRVVSLAATGKLFLLGTKFTWDIAKYFSPRGLRVRGLTDQEIETSIENKLRLPFKIIETTDWRAAADIDYQPDYEFFKRNYRRLKQKADLVKIS